MGVFQIRNTVNEKIFVGSCVNLVAIWNRNRSELALGGHRNLALQKEWNVTGEATFVFEVLSETVQKDGNITDYSKEVKEPEQLFIDEPQPFGKRG